MTHLPNELLPERSARGPLLQVVDDLPIDRSKLQNLPEAPEGTDPFFALAAAFLVSYPATPPGHTRTI